MQAKHSVVLLVRVILGNTNKKSNRDYYYMIYMSLKSQFRAVKDLI